MNGFAEKHLDTPYPDIRSDTKSPISAVKAFDAFPKTKASYTERTANGGVWTIVLICASIWLSFTELGRWWVGETTHSFSVEQGVGRDLQINIDMVVAMKCGDLHVNVQDASGDRVLAGEALKKDATLWTQTSSKRGQQRSLAQSKKERLELQQGGSGRDYREEDVHDYLGAARSRKKFARTPRVPRGVEADSCRIYGTIHTNKVQGDFHITARGHGYMEFGQHLDHGSKLTSPSLPLVTASSLHD